MILTFYKKKKKNLWTLTCGQEQGFLTYIYIYIYIYTLIWCQRNKQSYTKAFTLDLLDNTINTIQLALNLNDHLHRFILLFHPGIKLYRNNVYYEALYCAEIKVTRTSTDILVVSIYLVETFKVTKLSDDTVQHCDCISQNYFIFTAFKLNTTLCCHSAGVTAVTSAYCDVVCIPSIHSVCFAKWWC